MALSKDQVAAILEQFRKMRAGGAAVGVAITALAGDFDATESNVRYHLKAANLIGLNAEQIEVQPTDEDLGIGQEDEAEAPAPDGLAALMANPQLAVLIDKLVEQRMKRLGASATASVPGSDNGQFGAFLQKMERMIEAQTIQQPGYIRPLSPDELESRVQGHIEMRALLKKFEAEGRPPLYLLGGQFYAGDVLYEAGQEIRTYLPPAECFQPRNDPAVQVYTAMLQWIGGATPEIGQQLANAIVAAKAPPLVTGLPGGSDAAARGPVEVVTGRPAQPVGPKRVLGTLTPELHGSSMPPQPGVTSAPQGPAFVG